MSGPWSPGPWVVSSTHPTVVYGPDGRGVACMYATERARGNAVLIAAAPDLLEALVQVVNGLDWSLLLESDDLPDRKQVHASLLQAAESAIAKAKGEQP